MSKAKVPELKLNGKHGSKVDMKAYAAEREKREPGFAKGFEDAQQEHALGLELARLRKRTGMLQEQMAELMNTTKQTVSRLEQPTYKGHALRSLTKYVEALGGTFEVKPTKNGFRLEFTAPAGVEA